MKQQQCRHGNLADGSCVKCAEEYLAERQRLRDVLAQMVNVPDRAFETRHWWYRLIGFPVWGYDCDCCRTRGRGMRVDEHHVKVIMAAYWHKGRNDGSITHSGSWVKRWGYRR